MESERIWKERGDGKREEMESERRWKAKKAQDSALVINLQGDIINLYGVPAIQNYTCGDGKREQMSSKDSVGLDS